MNRFSRDSAGGGGGAALEEKRGRIDVVTEVQLPLQTNRIQASISLVLIQHYPLRHTGSLLCDKKCHTLNRQHTANVTSLGF